MLAFMQRLWPLKFLHLGQTLTLSKIFKNRFKNYIRFVLGKKRPQKTPNIREMTCFRNRHHIVSYAKDIAL